MPTTCAPSVLHPLHSNEDPMITTHSTLAAPSRFRRRLTSALLVLSLTAGTIAASATPADAASNVTGCFRSNKGYSLTGLPVQLQAYYLGTWFTVASQPLSSAGCVAWSVNPDSRSFYLRLVVNYQIAPAYWSGSSPLMALPGDVAVHLGTGVVTCYGCAY
jgi:hypothetical protein